MVVLVLTTSFQVSEKTQQRTGQGPKNQYDDRPNKHSGTAVTAEETVPVERVCLEKDQVSEDVQASAEARKKNIQTDGIDRDRR
ncbi:hypothetical protein [Arthrobacter sp. fls2-241-R2A-200]|uniref:hypothetical protein n=1 Tax=Arthrobacter sp. fls2-241-R2A-200 TaxID=3040281 RepID=UPI00254D87F8|nr:hypothetical protein [Arthrobacter sp. fls2-241-R2A-200]